MSATIGHLEKVRALAVAGRYLIVGGVRASAASRVSIFDLVGERIERVLDFPAHVLGLAAAADVVASAGGDGVVRTFTSKGEQVREIAAHAGACHAVALNDKVVASVGADGMLRVHDLKSGKLKKEWKLSARPLRAVAIDGAADAFAAGGDDGVVRVVSGRDGKREMPGHDGAVLCVAFTPAADGRLVSGGEDGTVRIAYLVGAVDADVRSKDDTIHTGGTTAIAFLPAPKDTAEGGDRFASAGVDGKLRIWRLADRRKPRTLTATGAAAADGSVALLALAFAPPTKSGTTGSLLAAGDGRIVFGFPCDAEGVPTDASVRFGSGFEVFAEALGAPARSVREAAVTELAALAEPEALTLAIGAMAGDKEPEVRALAASALASNGRRDARAAVRARLDDAHKAVRAAALTALLELEGDAKIAALRAAFDGKFVDTRAAALEIATPIAKASPLAAGLIAARLADEDATVRRAALGALVTLHTAGSVAPLRTAFERGRADLRAEVLARGALLGQAASRELAPLVGKALDDDDAEVRRFAFVVSVLARPALATWLDARDTSYASALGELARRVAEVEGKATGPEGLDPDVATVLDVSSAFARFQHPKHGKVAIFKPVLHAPLVAGAAVHLVGIHTTGPQDNLQWRAKDYHVGPVTVTAESALAEVRARLAPPVQATSLGEADREPLLAALACRAPDTALRGARALAVLGDLRALGALSTISREPDASLRRAAAHALALLDDPRAKKRLAWMMNDADAAVRVAAVTYYGHREPDPLAFAEVTLHASHEDVRARGLELLAKNGKGKAEAVALLGDALEDEAQRVRGEAFRTLWSWHDGDPLSPIDRALTARFPDVRRRAVDELASVARQQVAASAGALERLAKTIGDRDGGVARAAYDATLELKGKDSAETHLAAIGTTHPALRALGATDAKKHGAASDKVRGALIKLLEDDEVVVRVAAIEALDALLPQEPGPVAVGLQSSHLDLRVRAAELLAARREESIIDPMRALLADKELVRRMPAEIIRPLRHRAAAALASLGSPRLVKYFATELAKDDDPLVREQGARGLSNASRRGEEGYLLDLLGHDEIAMRSWAAEGLARLGDARALPVLVGTLMHEHAPIRVGAILSFAALGPEGHAGFLQGLEDPTREAQKIVLAVILARDLRAFRRGEGPDLVTSALASNRPEVRFAAARALELRTNTERYAAHLVEVLLPDKPDKAADLEKWPPEEARTRSMLALADAIAGDRSEQRYAAAQAFRLWDRPLDYFREVQRATALRSVNAPWAPETSPFTPPRDDEEAPKKGVLARLRQTFATSPSQAPAASAKAEERSVAPGEEARLLAVAFGAYVGLVRQASADDEAHRVRRDAIERIVDLVTRGHASLASAAPVLGRALDDPNHLVRQAAFAALGRVFKDAPEERLTLALASSSPDVARAALDEIAAAGDKARVARALDARVAATRKYAFELLEKLSPGSAEPLFAALDSEHADIRVGVLERLATSRDGRVAAALVRALESDHDDLRLRAAELLAERGDDLAADALAPWLRSDLPVMAARARDALARLGTARAVQALSARLDDEGVQPAERTAIATATAKTRAGEATIDLLARLAADGEATVRRAAFDGFVALIGARRDAAPTRGQPKPKPRDAALALRFLEATARVRHADMRAAAAKELEDLGPDPRVDGVVAAMLGDRDPGVRAAAVAAYAKRVEQRSAAPTPLEDVMRAGARATLLDAAYGVALKGIAAALRPLLLLARAGEPGERERALLGLGALGDPRGAAELELVASGGTEEAPADVSMQAAALEALGRLAPKLPAIDRDRLRDRVEGSVGTKENALAVAAVKGLRWLGGERSRARIEAVLAETSSSVAERVAAAKALGELGDAAAEATLGSALDVGSPEIRWAARDALDALFPDERVRVELLAVESSAPEISEPAAAYLANEGDAALLLAKLPKLKSEVLRRRIRFGLVRRAVLLVDDLTALLLEPSPEARSDAAFLAGARADRKGAYDEEERRTLGGALVLAAQTAATAHSDAVAGGRATRELAAAWQRAVWAARVIDVAAILQDARAFLADREAPPGVRVEAALALRGAAGAREPLTAALVDASALVRTAAAASLSPTADVVVSPADPVRTGAAAGDAVLPGALSTSAGRAALLARAIRSGATAELVALAGKGGDAQLPAIAALGRAATKDAIAALKALAARAGATPEPVRKAAYRSLRRASRIAGSKKEARS